MSSVISAFGDRTLQPTLDQMVEVVGRKRALWEQLCGYMDECRVPGELKFAGKSFGWILAFRRGGRSLFSMYPQQDDFEVNVVVGPTLVEPALALPVGEWLKTAIREAHPYPEGRWLFVKLASPGEASDIEKLVALKMRPPRRTSKGNP